MCCRLGCVCSHLTCTHAQTHKSESRRGSPLVTVEIVTTHKHKPTRTHKHTHQHVWHCHISFSCLPSECFMSARQDTCLKKRVCLHFFAFFDVLLGSNLLAKVGQEHTTHTHMHIDTHTLTEREADLPCLNPV